MNTMNTNPEAAETLLPGDVLLMLGHGELSKLIAWCGDSIYSHAAIVADDGNLIEAAASGVRRYSIATRLADTNEYFFVDAFRPLAKDGSGFDEADRAAVLAHAISLLGIPYPLDSLATLGVLVAVRQKWPAHWLARIVVREALDHLVKNNPSHMVCSEVVYRSLAECTVTPFAGLAPIVVLADPTHEPFPHVDWKALWDEVWPLLHPTRKAALAATAAQVQAKPAALMATGPAAVSDQDLAESTRAARAVLGLDPSTTANDDGALLHEAAEEGQPGTPIPNPNPKLVTPLDLAITPSHTVIGRLMQA
jgi:hypothetical protein